MQTLQAYYQALKPERTYANVMMTLAGFLFASQWHIDGKLLLATIVGTTLIVMSACAVNNCTDRTLDARMPRTKKRATVTGQVSARILAGIAVVLGVVGFGVLGLWVNGLVVLLGVIGYVDYVVLYGWTKRTTVYSTLVGTISGAVPLIAGYCAVSQTFDATALLLGFIMLFWQMVHFYAIGIFRRKDYKAGGLPIWPVQKGVKSTQRWMIGYTLAYEFVVCLLAVNGAGLAFGVVVGGLGLYWLFRGLDGLTTVDATKWARGMFGFSLVNLLVLAGMLAICPLLP